jgi:hypothetical protein
MIRRPCYPWEPSEVDVLLPAIRAARLSPTRALWSV